jgi:hypothetical protein
MTSVTTGDIALFPLRAVLFPHARTTLQVFEARYMDLVKNCLKADGGFGVILIKNGSEVYRPGHWRAPELADIGCYGRIVDWDALPQGRLALVLEGLQKFRLLESRQGPDHLFRGNVEWLAAESDQPLSLAFEQLPALLARLAEHPSIRQLNMVFEPGSALQTANQLAQLLPISLQEKQQLLSMDCPMDRLQQIEDFLAALES